MNSSNRTFRNVAAVFAIHLLAAQAHAAILNVCPSGCTYSLPSAGVNAAAAGDTVQIQAATYNDCIVVNKNNLTVVGVNGMAKLVNKVCLQKGIVVTAAQNAIIRNLELSGATNNDNYAGVRHDAAGFNLTLDNVYIHDNDDGILSSSSGDTVVIQNSRFENNGMNLGSGLAHNIYIGQSASFSFLNSTSNSAKLTGHELKTRAARNVISNSTIATLGGRDSRNIDVSNGGELIIQNSVIEKGPNSDNGDMIAFAPEGTIAGRNNTVTATGNIFIGDKANTTAFSYLERASSVNISSNKYVAVNGAPAGNTYYASRSAAGYQAYPWLPSPGASAPTATPTPTPAPTPTPTPVSSDWTFCANEGGTCSFSGTRTVRYGSGSNYATRSATGSIACTNAVFGDPIPGVVKHCDFSNAVTATPTPTPAPTPTPTPTPVSSTWTWCANEGGTCNISGTYTVRYGAGSSYVTRQVTGPVACTNAVFGDPAYGVAKHCDYSGAVAPTPTPTPTPVVWNWCANEGGTCNISGTYTVRYGAGSSYVTRQVTGPVACTNAVFGDPAYGVQKHCDYHY